MRDVRAKKLVKATTAALAAAFVAIPVAQARPAVDAHHAALLNREPAAQVDARHAALLNREPRVQVDARHAALLNKRPAVSVSGEDKLVQTPVKPSPAQVATPADSTGIDWSDAGIGASAGLGLALLAAAAALVTRRRLVGA